MRCSGCGQDNREGRKFCASCGARLALTCPACGEPNEPGERFCGECGGALLAQPRAEATVMRKVVTIVFADLAGSTALHERLDPESAALFMDGYYRAMRGAVEAHGGSVTQLLGDGVKAEFGVPAVAEDDAIRAVRAAVAMQQAFRALARQHSALVGKTGLRVAVNTGEVVAGAGSEIIGDPVNVAARLQEQAREGDVVIGETTHRLVAALATVERLGTFALKGRAEPVTAYRVVSLERPARAASGVFVGRDDELARITAVYASAIAGPRTHLAAVLGSPGLGKSRLFDELARRLGGSATLIAAHCDAGGGATFAPLAVALRALLGIDDTSGGEAVRAAIAGVLPAGDDAEATRIVTGVAALLGGSPAAPEETFFVVRRLLAALAATRAVVLVIDDLHWAEPLLLDLVEHLVQWGRGVPLLVVVGARPELRDLRATLCTAGALVSEVVTLGGLDASAAMRLAANVIGATDLPVAVAAKVLAASEGNPLFVGELVRMLVQEGALTREGERWTTGVGLASLEMPPTIHALLAARIERLRAEERAVLERAAVVGRHFSRGAVAALLSDGVADLDACLGSLTRSELIERDPGSLLGEPALRFHHVLIRDAAYRRLLKGTRAELHARLAGWVEAQAGDSSEHDETIGRHLEQAYRHLQELGPIDEHGRALGERASRHLAAAGRRALARDDVPVAAGLLGRALATLDPGDDARADLALDWCEALLAAGDVTVAESAIDELGRFTTSSPRLHAWHACFTGQLRVLRSPEALQATADAVASATADLAALGDAVGEATGHFVHAAALARLGRIGACEGALDRALAAARHAGDRRRANTVLAIAPLAALWGPSPVTRASGRCLDVVRVLRITQGAPAVEAVALSCQGVLEALRGRTDAARRMIASARRMVEELGITQRLLEADAFAGLVDLLEGDAAGAERRLRAAYDGLRELGLGIDAARAAALLARALLAQDRITEAEASSHASEALAGDDLKAASAWRGVRAEALAQRGEHAAAIRLASEAVDVAAATDALLDHADARIALATALRAAGRASEADAEERRAIELWEAKGATLLTERARHARLRVGEASAIAASSGATAPSAGGAITKAHAPVPRGERRVRPNAASRDAERVWAAVAARDLDQLLATHTGDTLVVHHPTGATYGRAEVIALFRQIWATRNLQVRQEILATLGDSLALVRRSYQHDGAETTRASIGAVVGDYFGLCERDERTPAVRRSEIFGEGRLADAVARLYARHAEMLAEGADADRARAAATAHSVATMTSVAATGNVEPLAAVLSPDLEDLDHRQLGLPSGRGADSLVRAVRALFELAADMTIRTVDVLALDDRAVLQRVAVQGTDRRSGGIFELPLLLLWAYGDDGLLARWEAFDADRDAQALERFAVLTQSTGARDEAQVRHPVPEAPVVRRSVPTNAASHLVARFASSFAAGDETALRDLFTSSLEVVDHPTGATYGRDGHLASVRRLRRAQDPVLCCAPVARLGDRLVLCHRHIGASGTGGHDFDVGAYERDEIVLFEVDAGACARIEIFAEDHLGDALVALYVRYATTLAAGPERARAEAIARTLATAVRPAELDAWCATIADDFDLVDHRVLGVGALHGGEAMRANFRAMFALEAHLAVSVVDVLATQPDALLVRLGNSGVARDGGGAYERWFLQLAIFDRDGRVGHMEYFDDDRDADALMRFAALTAGDTSAATAEPFANAASASAGPVVERLRAHDWQGFRQLFAESFRMSDRRRVVQLDLDREQYVAFTREVSDGRTARNRWELVATRGDRLALTRTFWEFADGDVGPSEIAFILLMEVDERGRIVANVRWDLDDLDAAHTELDVRFDAGEGAAQPAHGAIMRAFTRAVVSRDWDPVLVLCAPEFVEHDHRSLAVLGTTHGAAAWAQNFGTLVDLAPDTIYRTEHLRSAGRGFCSVGTWIGSRDGARYEIPLIAILELDGSDRLARADIYDLDQLDQALARFAELAISTRPAARFANAASRAWQQALTHLRTGDWSGLAQVLPDGFRVSDRRRLMQLELQRDSFIDFVRSVAGMRSYDITASTIATRGERLQLSRTHTVAAGDDVGPSEFEILDVLEIDERGVPVALIRFDADDLDAARAELDARWAAVAGTSRIPANAASRVFDRVAAYVADEDWEGLGAFCAPIRWEDRRPLLRRTGGSDVFVEHVKQIQATRLAPTRTVLATAGERLALQHVHWRRLDDGRLSEVESIDLTEVDAEGRIVAVVIFDPAERRAADDELFERSVRNGDAGIPPAAVELQRAVNAHDLDRIRAIVPEGFVIDDRRLTGVGRHVGRDAYLASLTALHELSADVTIHQLRQVAVARHGLVGVHRMSGSNAEGGAFESIHVAFLRFAGGFAVATELFDLADLDDAIARFDETRPDALRLPPSTAARVSALQTDLLAALDWPRFRALVGPGFVYEDRSRKALVRGDVETWITSLEFLTSLPGAGGALSPIGQLGDRIRVEEFSCRGDGFALHKIRLLELDADGRTRTVLLYDPEDRARAMLEALERFGFGEGESAPGLAPQLAITGSFLARDWVAMRDAVAPDLVFADHRPLGLGTLGRDAWIASMQALPEMAPDAAIEMSQVLAWSRHGIVVAGRWFGTRDGGPFESDFTSCCVAQDGRAVRIEAFPITDAERAVARFDELCAALDP